MPESSSSAVSGSSRPTRPPAVTSVLDNFRSPGALARFLLAVLIGLSLDLWTKQQAFERLAAGPPYQIRDVETGKLRWIVETRPDLRTTDGLVVIPRFLNLRVTVNEGAVFGVGQGRRWIFVAISIAAIGFLGWLFASSGRQRFYQVILGMLLAGVLGNMYDRIHFGYVRDMIYALPKWGAFPWIFNVADSLLCVGVALVFIHSIFHSRHKPAAAVTAPGPAA
jgi:lipoprotein signal peptidase